jgi:hypothetical protein
VEKVVEALFAEESLSRRKLTGIGRMNRIRRNDG